MQDRRPKAKSTHALLSRTRSRIPLNDPTPDQAFLAENYDENARRADRGIFPTTTYAFAPTAGGLVGPLGSSSFSPEMVELAFVEMEGSDTCANLGSLSLGGRAGAATFPILGSVPSLM